MWCQACALALVGLDQPRSILLLPIDERGREAIWLGQQRGMFDVDEPQRSFASAEEAVQAFIAALRNHREAELRAILHQGRPRHRLWRPISGDGPN